MIPVQSIRFASISVFSRNGADNSCAEGERGLGSGRKAGQAAEGQFARPAFLPVQRLHAPHWQHFRACTIHMHLHVLFTRTFRCTCIIHTYIYMYMYYSHVHLHVLFTRTCLCIIHTYMFMYYSHVHVYVLFTRTCTCIIHTYIRSALVTYLYCIYL